MAKIMVCDICKKDNKLTESNRYMAIKGMSELRIDYCDNCKNRIPNKMKDYIKFVFGLRNLEVTVEDIVRMYGERIKL